jgi:hypothetical protein
MLLIFKTKIFNIILNITSLINFSLFRTINIIINIKNIFKQSQDLTLFKPAACFFTTDLIRFFVSAFSYSGVFLQSFELGTRKFLFRLLRLLASLTIVLPLIFVPNFKFNLTYSKFYVVVDILNLIYKLDNVEPTLTFSTSGSEYESSKYSSSGSVSESSSSSTPPSGSGD